MNNKDELDIISTCFKKIVNGYENICLDYKINLGSYLLYIDDSNAYLKILLNDYISECQYILLTNSKLENYEKAACLAIAIRNNPCFNLVDNNGIVHYKFSNSNFAIDVALSFCENNILKDNNIIFNHIFSEFEELAYSKYLLADILESNFVYPDDIINNFKLQLELIKNVINYKNKRKNYIISH